MRADRFFERHAAEGSKALRRWNKRPYGKEVKMSRSIRIQIAPAVVIALGALFLVSPRDAHCATLSEDSAAEGHRLAAAWCKECHAIEARPAGNATAAPDFADIASRPSTTALSLKVFLRTNHPTMPNIVIAPDQADDLANYILGLKRN
jgi:mono/diheme cytochrome c family protein